MNCDNQIAENGRKKILWLPKSGEEFKKKKTKVLRPQYFLQHFHNKSKVISCY